MSNGQARKGLGAARLVVAPALCTMLAACGSTQSVVNKPGNYGGGPVEITVTPTTADVFYGGRFQFAANVTGGSNQGVNWTVSEDSGGAVSASGEYTAPAVAGTFHIVAQSQADASKSATATVTVRASPGTLPTLTPGVWTNISPPGLEWGNGVMASGMALDPSNPATIYLCVGHFDPTPSRAGLFKSTDGGTSWARLGQFMEPGRVRVDPRNPRHLYVGDGVRGSTNGFWVSNDGGATWAQPDGFTRITEAFVLDVYDVAVDPADFNHVLLASHSPWSWTDPASWNYSAGVLESRDGGANWILHPPPLRWGYGHNIWFLSNSTTWLLGTQDSGGFFRTTDSGGTWSRVSDQSIQHGGGLLYRTNAGPLYMSCNCGNEAGVMRSSDDGVTWTVMPGSPAHANAVFGDGRLLYTHTNFAGVVPFYTASESDGAPWTPYRGGAQSFSDGPLEMAFDSGRRILYSSDWTNGLLALKVMQ